MRLKQHKMLSPVSNIVKTLKMGETVSIHRCMKRMLPVRGQEGSSAQVFGEKEGGPGESGTWRRESREEGIPHWVDRGETLEREQADFKSHTWLTSHPGFTLSFNRPLWKFSNSSRATPIFTTRVYIGDPGESCMKHIWTPLGLGKDG